MLSSMVGVIIALTLLGYAFHLAEAHSPAVTAGAASTCPAPDCSTCLHQVSRSLLFFFCFMPWGPDSRGWRGGGEALHPPCP